MKKCFMILLFLCLPILLACKQQPASEPEAKPAVTVPAECEVKLRLPLGSRSDVAEAIPAYTAGFQAIDGTPMHFTVSNGDTHVAEGVLKEDGTLYVIAHGTGETKLTVIAVTASGEQGSAAVSVKVTDARRTLALIALGVLAVVLLVLLGKPAAKKPEAQKEPAAPEPEEKADPVVIFEEPKEPAAIFEDDTSNDNPERS